MARLKLQSAMEYLMTYGWAILIIAVVLGAMFALGFFNSANLAPKVPPGSCQVFRPSGPGTTTNINTEGTCVGLPQYAAKFDSSVSANILATVPLATTGTGSSVSFWMDPTYVTSPSASTLFAFTGGGSVTLSAAGATACRNSWVYVVAVGATVYVDGVSAASSSVSCASDIAATAGAETAVEIGGGSGGAFSGLLSNVQLYNSSLDANTIRAMYLKGIGGVPIELTSLAGWWPLNQNAKDYSGNLYDGTPSTPGISYTSDWSSGYTAP